MSSAVSTERPDSPQPPPHTFPSERASMAWSVAWRAVLAAAVTVVGLWLVVQLRQELVEVLIAIILASGLRPLVQRLHDVGIPRGLAILLIYLGFILLLALLGLLVIPPLVQQAQDFIRHAPGYATRIGYQIDNIQRALNLPTGPDTALAGQIQRALNLPTGPDTALAGQLRNITGQIGSLAGGLLQITRVVLGVFSGVLAVILTLLITFYFTVDGNRIRGYFLGFVAPARREQAEQIGDRMGERMGRWLLGQVALSGVIGLCSYVALLILGVPGALLLAVIAAIGEAIPIFGPIISAIPAVLVALTDSPIKALLVVVAYIVIQQLESNILAPNIMAKAVKLHPLAVLLALLVGAKLLGVVGAVISVPITAALSVAADEWKQSRQRRFAAADGQDPSRQRQEVPDMPNEPDRHEA